MARVRGRKGPGAGLPLALGVYGGLARAALCLGRRWGGGDTPLAAALAGGVAGLSATFYRSSPSPLDSLH